MPTTNDRPARPHPARHGSGLALALALVLAVACAPATDAGSPATTPRAPATAPSAAAAPTAPTPVAVPEVDLVIAVPAPAQGLDPRERIDPMSLQRILVVMEPLVALDATLGLRPRLATAWAVSDEGRTITFELRDDVTFHDGWRFTSADVRFTIETGGAPDRQGTVRAVANLVERIETPDERTVVLHLVAPAAHVLFDLARMPIVPANAAADFDERPIGTGPYALEIGAPDGVQVLRRHDAYWGEHTGPERIAFQLVARSVDVADAMLAGRVHLSHRPLDGADRDRLAAAPGVAVEVVANTTGTYLGFDTTTAPFDDADARRALSLLIPRAPIVEELLPGQAVPSTTMVPPVVSWAAGGDAVLEGGRAAAEALLAQNGPLFERPLVLLTNVNPLREAMAARIQSTFEEAGIDVRVETVEFVPYLNRLAEGDFDLFLIGTVATANPDQALGAAALNYEGYEDARIADLLAQAARLDPTSDDAIALYREALVAWLEGSPRAYLSLGLNVGVRAAGITGWAPHPLDAHAYQDLHRIALP